MVRPNLNSSRVQFIVVTYYTYFLSYMPKLRALVLPYLHSSMHFQILSTNYPRYHMVLKLFLRHRGPIRTTLW